MITMTVVVVVLSGSGLSVLVAFWAVSVSCENSPGSVGTNSDSFPVYLMARAVSSAFDMVVERLCCAGTLPIQTIGTRDPDRESIPAT